jgi:hypothetical protein
VGGLFIAAADFNDDGKLDLLVAGNFAMEEAGAAAGYTAGYLQHHGKSGGGFDREHNDSDADGAVAVAVAVRLWSVLLQQKGRNKKPADPVAGNAGVTC